MPRVWTRTFFVFFCSSLFLLLTPLLGSAQTFSVGSTNNAEASGESVSRKTFFDRENSRYWSFYSSGSGLVYAYSPDGLNWTSAGSLNYTSSDFSVHFGVLSGTPYVFLAAQANSHDVILRRGVLSAADISFDPEITYFNGTSTSDRYTSPSVILDSNERLWIAAIHDSGPEFSDHFQARVRRSTNTATNNLSLLENITSIGKRSQYLSSLTLLPQPVAQLLLILNSESGKIIGHQFDGAATWSEVSGGGSFDWFSFGGSFSGTVNALLSVGADLYVAGSFEDIGGISTANNIARWDGSRWNTLGTGTNGAVHALAVSGGSLYVGGAFSSAGGTAFTSRVARWDGSSWHALGTGGSAGTVFSIAADGSNVIIGGSFTNFAFVGDADNIARWTGAAWQGVGGGLSSSVHEIISDGNGSFFVGGAFTNAGADPDADYLAHLAVPSDTWSNVGGGALTANVNALAIDGTSLYVGGDFTDANAIPEADYIVRYETGLNSWHALDQGLNGAVTDIIYSAGSIFAAGSFSDAGADLDADGVAEFNGAAWNRLGVGTAGSSVQKLARDASGDLYLGGGSSPGGNTNASGLSRFSAGNFFALGGGINGSIQVMREQGGILYVGGRFRDLFGNDSIDYLAAWDGTSWSGFGDADQNIAGAGVYSLIVNAANDIIIGGEFDNFAGIAQADRIARWDGATWSGFNNGIASGTVYALQSHGGNIFVGGAFTSIDGDLNLAHIAAWDGANWDSLVANGVNDEVRALLSFGGSLYLGGQFTNAGGDGTADYIAAWNGVALSGVSGGLNGDVNALAEYAGDLVAGGNFTNADGDPDADRIALWDGLGWVAIGTGLNATVQSLFVDGADLYVGGSFTNAGGIAAADRIARRSAGAWSALGSGLNADVFALQTVGSRVYAGGSFTGLGGSGIGPQFFGYFAEAGIVDSGPQSEISALSFASGNVHLTYSAQSGALRYASFNYGTALWSAPVTIDASTTTRHPTISFDAGTSQLRIAWSNGTRISAKQAVSPWAAGDWAAQARVIYETGTNLFLSAAELAGPSARSTLLIWTSGSSAPYTVRSAFSADAVGPLITTVTSSKPSGSYSSGELIPVTVTFDENVDVQGGGIADIALNSGAGAKAVYVSGDGSTTLQFSYTVQPGDNAATLDYASNSALALNGATFADSLGNQAILTLPTPGSASSLSPADIEIDTASPAAPVVQSPLTNSTLNANAVLVEGSAEAFSTITLSEGATTLGSTTADGLGSWSLNTGALAQGTHTLSLKAEDAAGNESALSTLVLTLSFQFTLDGIVRLGSAPLSGVVIDGAALGQRTTGTDGRFSFENVGYNTSYSLTPSKAGVYFSPLIQGGVLTSARSLEFVANVVVDTDGDGTPDHQDTDDDNDGLSDSDEGSLGTDPLDSDSDEDEISDGQEVLDGSDALDRGSFLERRGALLCGGYNSFFAGVWNVLEYLNTGAESQTVRTEMFDSDGLSMGSSFFSLAALGQKDLLVHEDMQWSPNRYGSICTERSEVTLDASDARLVLYRENSERFEFALSTPLTEGTRGNQYLQFNTYQPSLNWREWENRVAHWVSLLNFSNATQSGVLRFFDAEGTELGSVFVQVPGKGRRDFPLHEWVSPSYGLLAWEPTDKADAFSFFASRYYFDNATGAESFSSATHIAAQIGSGSTRYLPVDFSAGDSVLELSNTSTAPSMLSVEAFNALGAPIGSLSFSLEPKSSQHILLRALFLNTSIGSLRIRGEQRESIISTLLSYARGAEGITWAAVKVHSREALGKTWHRSYNSFLEQSCSAWILNTTNSPQQGRLKVRAADGSILGTEQVVNVPGQAVQEIDICGTLPQDSYGQLIFEADSENSLLLWSDRRNVAKGVWIVD